MAEPQTVSSGVQNLIDRLRGEGVEAGEREAERIVDEARKRGAKIVAEAKAEADEYRTQAREEIKREGEAAKAALQVAVRDTNLDMRSQIAARFAAQVKRLVSEQLGDKEFIRRMILAVAGRAAQAAEGHPAEIEISQALFAGEGAGEDMQRQIDATILGFSAEMLREGVEIKMGGEGRPGIRVRLVGEDVEIDLTDEAIAEALLSHLQPRYREIARGIQDTQ